MPEFQYQEMFPLAPDETPYRQIGGTETVRAIDAGGHRILQVDPSALTVSGEQAPVPGSHTPGS